MSERHGAFVSQGQGITAAARFSEDGVYRYSVRYTWDPAKPCVTFCLLNPSTATHECFDPTLTRCFGFAKSWGYGEFIIVNLFALRSTDPRALYVHPDPVGALNDIGLLLAARAADKVVCGWGAHGHLGGRWREVITLLYPLDKLHYLALTKKGQPKHPLYLKRDLWPVKLDLVHA